MHDPAKPTVQQDNERTRVTLWGFRPGAARGQHIHEMDYVIVPLTTGKLTLVNGEGMMIGWWMIGLVIVVGWWVIGYVMMMDRLVILIDQCVVGQAMMNHDTKNKIVRSYWLAQFQKRSYLT